MFTPKLVAIIHEGYGFKDFQADAIAGLTVAIVALPLSMVIAIASGLSPDRELFTAIIAANALEAIIQKLHRRHTQVYIVGAGPSVRRTLLIAGLRKPEVQYRRTVADARERPIARQCVSDQLAGNYRDIDGKV